MARFRRVDPQLHLVWPQRGSQEWAFHLACHTLRLYILQLENGTDVAGFALTDRVPPDEPSFRSAFVQSVSAERKSDRSPHRSAGVRTDEWLIVRASVRSGQRHEGGLAIVAYGRRDLLTVTRVVLNRRTGSSWEQCDRATIKCLGFEGVSSNGANRPTQRPRVRNVWPFYWLSNCQAKTRRVISQVWARARLSPGYQTSASVLWPAGPPRRRIC